MKAGTKRITPEKRLAWDPGTRAPIGAAQNIPLIRYTEDRAGKMRTEPNGVLSPPENLSD